MKFANPKIGPTIRHKTKTSVTIVIHGDKNNKYGYVRLYNDNYNILLSAELDERKYYGHRFTFNNLRESTEYYYQVGVTDRSYLDVDDMGNKIHKFTTLSNDKYSFALGSCRFYANLYGYLSIGNKLSDAPFKQIAKHNIDSMYIVGDHPYMDCIKELSFIRLKSHDNIFRNHIVARSTKGFKQVASKVNVQEVPDDHEYRDNGTPSLGEEEPETYRNAIDGINIFQIHSGPHNYGDNVPYWKHEDLGICEVFICDTRYERYEDNIMSDIQFNSLLTALINKESSKPFLIFTPVPFILAQHGSDMWKSFPKHQKQLLSHILECDIRNVFILTGDSHVSVTTDFDFYENNKPTDNKIVEIMSSPLYQVAHDTRNSIQNKFDVDDNLYLFSKEALSDLRSSVIRVNNYAIIDVLVDHLTVTYYKSSNGKELRNVTYHYW